MVSRCNHIQWNSKYNRRIAVLFMYQKSKAKQIRIFRSRFDTLNRILHLDKILFANNTIGMRIYMVHSAWCVDNFQMNVCARNPIAAWLSYSAQFPLVWQCFQFNANHTNNITLFIQTTVFFSQRIAKWENFCPYILLFTLIERIPNFRMRMTHWNR